MFFVILNHGRHFDLLSVQGFVARSVHTTQIAG
jgi:hypothetical protein